MNKDYLIEKWLNDDLTASELEDFKKLEDYQLYVDIIDNAQLFKAESFSKVDSVRGSIIRYMTECYHCDCVGPNFIVFQL